MHRDDFIRVWIRTSGDSQREKINRDTFADNSGSLVSVPRRQILNQLWTGFLNKGLDIFGNITTNLHNYQRQRDSRIEPGVNIPIPIKGNIQKRLINFAGLMPF